MALAGILHAEPDQQRAVAGKVSIALSVGAPPACSSRQQMPKPRYLPRFCRLAAALLEAVVVGKLQRLVEHRLEIAAVDRWCRPAVLYGIADFLIRLRRRSLTGSMPVTRAASSTTRSSDVARFRPAGAAIGRGRQRVGEHAFDADIDSLMSYMPGRQRVKFWSGYWRRRRPHRRRDCRRCARAAPEIFPSRRARARPPNRCRAPDCRDRKASERVDIQ